MADVTSAALLVAANPVFATAAVPLTSVALLPQAAKRLAKVVASRSLNKVECSGLRERELDFTVFLGQKKA